MTTPPTPRSGILAGGNWIIDHVKTLDGWPQQDALANILSESWGNGGSPYNILKDLSRLGAGFPLSAIGLVGDDADGQRILADCRTHGIDTAQLRATSQAPTSYSDVMTDRTTGRRTFFHQRGANALLSPEHFDFSATSAKIFHLGYLLLLDGLDTLDNGIPKARDVLRRAHAAGLITSLDCVSEASDRFHAVVKPVLPEADILFVNDYEAEQLTGLTLGRAATINRAIVEQAARTLLAFGVRHHVIIHFPEGACAASSDGTVIWQPSVRVPAALIAGAAGAGDAFASGCLLALHNDQPLAAALELGVCAAATSLLHPTCSESVLPATEALRFGQKHGFHSLA
ncbi:MAG TPA: carbohydrate kinase family protein [Rariglobus sp.]|nr:carbohydrate kinase family protein [Rariglobus sp.]